MQMHILLVTHFAIRKMRGTETALIFLLQKFMFFVLFFV